MNECEREQERDANHQWKCVEVNVVSLLSAWEESFGADFPFFIHLQFCFLRKFHIFGRVYF